jgi:hypothetical protein
MDRRSVIKNAGIAGILAAGVAPAVHAQAAIRWRLASSFPKSLDTIHGAADTFAKAAKAMSVASSKFGPRRWRNHACIRRGRRCATRLYRNGSHSPLLLLR